MANFKVHVTVATVLCGALSTGLMVSGVIDAPTSIILMLAGIIGGVLPDIDSDHSIALDISFTLLAVIVSFLVMFNQPYGRSVVEMLLVWCGAYLVMRFVVLRMFRAMTRHRGLFHSIPAAMLAGLVALHLMTSMITPSPIDSWLIGIFVTVGYLIHLLLDELNSINFLNVRIKQSSGTAFKLYESDHLLLSAVIYVAVAILFFAAPEQSQVGDAILNGDRYIEIWSYFLPKGSWFSGGG
jgi:hypothetical protein